MKTIKRWLMILLAITCISITTIPISYAEPITGQTASDSTSSFVGTDDNDDAYDADVDNPNGDEYQNLISIIIWLTKTISVFGGLIFIVIAFKNMVLYTEVGAEGKHAVKNKMIFGLIIGVLMLNITSTVDSVVKTFNSESKGACYITNEDALEDWKIGKNKDMCWSVASSQISGPTFDKVKSMIDSQNAGGLEGNLKNIISGLQMVGFLFFVNALFALHKMATGSGQRSFIGVMGQLCASTLIVDLVHTIATVQATMKILGLEV
jgi:hypothetical protein